MTGIETVRDQRTKEKAADLRNAVVNLAFHKGLLVLGAGENTLRLSPPLLIDQEQADFAVRTLEDCFREAEKRSDTEITEGQNLQSEPNRFPWLPRKKYGSHGIFVYTSRNAKESVPRPCRYFHN